MRRESSAGVLRSCLFALDAFPKRSMSSSQAPNLSPMPLSPDDVAPPASTGDGAPAGDRRTDLRALDRDGLEAFAQDLGQPAYRGRQLFTWIYGHGVTDFAAMTSLPKAFRRELARRAVVSTLTEASLRVAHDRTTKALYRLPSGRPIETVLIPDLDATGAARRLTVCVSSQVGCAMGCTFCATGQMGFHENVLPGHIAEQVHRMDRLAHETFGRGVTNVVYMGMGEPLLNYDGVMQSVAILTHEDGLGLSPRRLTVSTVGLARRIRDLADDGARFGLAVSLHAPTNAQRSRIMPVNRAQKTDLDALKAALQYYHDRTGRAVTYEYCLFDGVNDRVADAERLAAITRWAPSKVNLIMYNPVAAPPVAADTGTDAPRFGRTPDAQLDRFIRTLVEAGVTVTVRRSRGQDIDAACGQLASEA